MLCISYSLEPRFSSADCAPTCDKSPCHGELENPCPSVHQSRHLPCPPGVRLRPLPEYGYLQTRLHPRHLQRPRQQPPRGLRSRRRCARVGFPEQVFGDTPLPGERTIGWCRTGRVRKPTHRPMRSRTRTGCAARSFRTLRRWVCRARVALRPSNHAIVLGRSRRRGESAGGTDGAAAVAYRRRLASTPAGAGPPVTVSGVSHSGSEGTTDEFLITLQFRDGNLGKHWKRYWEASLRQQGDGHSIANHRRCLLQTSLPAWFTRIADNQIIRMEASGIQDYSRQFQELRPFRCHAYKYIRRSRQPLRQGRWH